MSTIRTKAIVLRRTNYGEADRILQLLTPDHGKLSVMAKGVRREKSKLAGGVELFARSDITIMQGKSDMGILTGARLEEFYRHIMGDIDRLQFGYEAIKQVGRAAETIDEPAFFELLDQTFAALNDLKIDLMITKTWFWLQLAILLGAGLNLTTDVEGNKLQADQRYSYAGDDHGFREHEKGDYGSEEIKIMRLLSAQSPRVAVQVKGIKELLPVCLRLAEQAVAH